MKKILTTILSLFIGSGLLFGQNTGDWAVDYTQDTTPPAGAILTWQFNPGGGLVQYYSTLAQAGASLPAEYDAVTWSDGANASNIWTFDVSGTDPTLTFGNGIITLGGDFTVTGEYQSSSNIVLQLGDSLGANKLSIQDSSSVEQFSVNSDGDVTALGDFSVANLNADALFILDSVDQSHGLSFTAESNLTAARELQFTTGDANVPVNLTDANADRLFGWDDTAGTWEPVTIGSGLSYDGTTLTATAGSTTESVSFTIMEPDLVQPVSDEILLKHFVAEKYPSGVTMVSWHVSASTTISDTFNLIKSTSPTASAPTTMESITVSAAAEAEDDGSFTDGAVAADGYVFLDFNATVPDNVAFLTVTLTYTIN